MSTKPVCFHQPPNVPQLEQLAEQQFAGPVDGAGVVSVARNGDQIVISCEQTGDGSIFQSRMIQIAVGTQEGQRRFLSATITTVDILGNSTTERLSDQRQLDQTVLSATPLANLVRAMTWAQKNSQQ
jgi:hypothetical protein